jgi:hypothetical protein
MDEAVVKSSILFSKTASFETLETPTLHRYGPIPLYQLVLIGG